MANIRIFADLKTDKVVFSGSRVSDKEIGSLSVEAHPSFSDRITIASTTLFRRNSTTVYRTFFKRLKISRIENRAGQQLTAAPLNYDRDQVIAYLVDQFEKDVVNDHFEYNPATDRLVAQKDIEVQKNGFFLGS